MTIDLDFVFRLAYALGVGILIGLERSFVQVLSTDQPATSESSTDEQKELQEEFIGVRTFAMLSLLGFSSAVIGEHFPSLAPVTLAGVCLLVIAMYIRATHHGIGITTEVAAIATCALGMLCHFHPQIAGILAILITVLLASKNFTYKTIRKMRRVELTDTLKFLVVCIIVLPLLPDKALDPFEAFNPYKVGLLVVLISGISFFGYFLTRIFGAQKGLGLTGVLGGLTSSTAVTAAMSAEAKKNPKLNSICAFSTLAANATMFFRVLVVVALLDQALVLQLAWSLGSMAITTALAAMFLWFSALKTKPTISDGSGQVQLKNPFSLGPAIKFAIFFVLILFVAKLSKEYFGDSGLFAAAGLSGLADVDAITLSIAEQTNQNKSIQSRPPCWSNCDHYCGGLQ
jgi:uncharacterized membrane protein (DUF4010 family)